LGSFWDKVRVRVLEEKREKKGLMKA